jgi:hypothetical protein
LAAKKKSLPVCSFFGINDFRFPISRLAKKVKLRFHVILPFAVEAAPFRGMEMLRKLKFGKCTFAREFGECIFSEELAFLQILIWQICLNFKY